MSITISDQGETHEMHCKPQMVSVFVQWNKKDKTGTL